MKIVLGQPYSFCQIGRRSNQEDARFPNEDKPINPAPYYVVCDGVGGEEDGEIASRTVCDAFAKYLNKHFDTTSFTVDVFRNVLDYAYTALYKKGKSNTSDMATTLTFVCFHDGGVMAAHIGDSRIYHIRPDVGILYRSDDHSLVNALVHTGNLTPEAAINHPQRNIITRCMECVSSESDRAKATVMEINDVEPGDYFFLCTDGVLDKLDDDDILNVLSEDAEDGNKIKAIAERCADSNDNNTAYIIPVKNVLNNKEERKISDIASGPSDTQTINDTIKEATDVIAKKKDNLFDKIIKLLKS